ncbi:MAG: hypothetical protein HZC47_11110 [Methanobacterium sp.]|uniref:hypothetical protein n=1 Tax=Methanobacterium sp. TaxID=2164 RepID=UPI003D656E47|nr:hypothetical protein [Methanobacterium sp.]
MNIRVLSIIFVILIFALGSGYLSYSVSGGTALKDAYSNGNIKVIQKTSAGTVPHEVIITNDGNVAVKVKKGDVLSSTPSQDLVIGEDKKVASNSNETVKAYCIEPSQRAVANTKLLPVNSTYNGVTQVIRNSNPLDPESAYKAQLQIYLIMSGGNLNIYTGEPVAIVDTKKISWTQFRQDVSNAKSDLMKTFNVNESEIKDLNQKQGLNVGNPQTWIDNFSNWLKGLLGM